MLVAHRSANFVRRRLPLVLAGFIPVEILIHFTLEQVENRAHDAMRSKLAIATGLTLNRRGSASARENTHHGHKPRKFLDFSALSMDTADRPYLPIPRAKQARPWLCHSRLS